MSNVLEGKTVERVWLAKDRLAMRFDVMEGPPIIARADADCCSYTWIEGIDMPDVLLGTVRAVEDIPMPDLGSPDEYGVIAYYGCRITTERGVCVIDYRNESNGYYGGWIHWSVLDGEGYDDDSFYGGVYGQNQSAMEWELIAGESEGE